jgi:site-specific DNA-methyltransferase (adenine-specific)
MLELNKLYCGDCLDKMKDIDDNYIDLMVTDPPYGYSFMGKDWDKAVMGVEYWRECYRVLKDGAFAFIMSSPRQDVLSRMIVNLQDAGFNTGFTSIYWTYASGFPKAYNIAKGVEGKIKLGTANWAEWDRLDGEKGIRQMGYYKTNAEDGNRPNNYNGTERTTKVNLTTHEAKSLAGSYAGFQPKPAVEVILVVMKPLSEKTYVEQAMKNGKGVTWLDDGKIPTTEDLSVHYNSIRKSDDTMGERIGKFGFRQGKDSHAEPPKVQGRFPANLLVSDDVLNDGLDRKSNKSNNDKSASGGIWNESTGHPAGDTYDDSGSFSRYFDLDKWWEKLNELPESLQRTFPFIITPKANKGERNEGCGELVDKKSYTQNNHPTVKPIKLISYLITLGSRQDDIILDPFLGSGTTAVACVNLKRNFIGIELSDEYYNIAKTRIEHAIDEKKMCLF